MMTDTALDTAATVTPNFVQGYPNCTQKFGGADRDRTGDLMLAKHALSQLSYSPFVATRYKTWWAWVESNYRPHPYQGCALAS
jgi:hypothetical protein